MKSGPGTAWAAPEPATNRSPPHPPAPRPAAPGPDLPPPPPAGRAALGLEQGEDPVPPAEDQRPRAEETLEDRERVARHELARDRQRGQQAKEQDQRGCAQPAPEEGPRLR